DCDATGLGLAEDAVRTHIPIKTGDYGVPYELVECNSSPDNRLMGGPRTTGHTTMRLAFLRNLILERFQESDCDLLLMPDSDVILAPGALRAMADEYRNASAAAQWNMPLTVTLQLDNRLAVDDAPASNGQVLVKRPQPVGLDYAPAPYATDGSVIEVARAGACTLYPRSVLERRFRWDPRYQEEHQALFDDLRELGFRHYLIRDPNLCEHRRRRIPSGFEVLRQLRAEREAAEAAAKREDF
ncbi:MAG: hypothetical protein VW405_23640, partial [Rhodospirillaceae bacterium]